MIASLLVAGFLATSSCATTDEGDGLPGALNGPTREEVAALVREVGRDEPTDAVVDEVLSYFRPRSLVQNWSWEQTTERLKNAQFVAEADAIVREVNKAPATTPMLVRLVPYLPKNQIRANGYDFVNLLKPLTEPKLSFDGRITDEQGQALSGVMITTQGGLTTTDERGRFTLTFPKPIYDYATVHFETPGYALGETNFDIDAIDSAQGRTYTLRKQAVCDGQVIDAETKLPIADAEITLWVHHLAFDPEPTDIDPRGHRTNMYFTLITRSDDQGRYAFRGLPPRNEASEYASTIRATHPDYLTIQDHFGNDQLPRAGITIPMTAGASVGGYVTDPEGNRVPFANVQVFRVQNRASLGTTTADARGEFHLNNLAEQEVRVAADSDGFAMTYVPATADRQAPVWLKVQLRKGEFIEGTLIGPDGKPAVKATVGTPYLLTDAGAVDNTAPMPSRSATTAEDGTFKLGPLLPGRYRIYGTIQKPEYFRIFVDVPTGPNHLVIGKPPE